MQILKTRSIDPRKRLGSVVPECVVSTQRTPSADRENARVSVITIVSTSQASNRSIPFERWRCVLTGYIQLITNQVIDLDLASR